MQSPNQTSQPGRHSDAAECHSQLARNSINTIQVLALIPVHGIYTLFYMITGT